MQGSFQHSLPENARHKPRVRGCHRGFVQIQQEPDQGPQDPTSLPGQSDNSGPEQLQHLAQRVPANQAPGAEHYPQLQDKEVVQATTHPARKQ